MFTDSPGNPLSCSSLDAPTRISPKQCTILMGSVIQSMTNINPAFPVKYASSRTLRFYRGAKTPLHIRRPPSSDRDRSFRDRKVGSRIASLSRRNALKTSPPPSRGGGGGAQATRARQTVPSSVRPSVIYFLKRIHLLMEMD